MAQLVVSAAAAGVGFMIGGPAGAQIGWMIGSTVAAIAMAPDAPDGPRIADKGVRVGAYGQMIPITAGTIRVTADLIWCSDLIESSEEVGGKGGGGATQYSYSVNMLVQVCESPEGEPRTPLRIWANGRMIWRNDGTPDGAVDDELIQPGNLRWYAGQDAQDPDPVYEAAVGVAPAHLGYLTIMLEGLQVGFSANRPPTIEVEVTESVTLSDEQIDIVVDSSQLYYIQPVMSARLHGYWICRYAGFDSVNARIWDERTGAQYALITMSDRIQQILVDPLRGGFWVLTPDEITLFSPTGIIVVSFAPPSNTWFLRLAPSGSLWALRSGGVYYSLIDDTTGADLGSYGAHGTFPAGGMVKVDADDRIWGQHYSFGYTPVLIRISSTAVDAFDLTTLGATALRLFDYDAYADRIIAYVDSDAGPRIWIIDPDSFVVMANYADPINALFDYEQMLDPEMGRLWYMKEVDHEVGKIRYVDLTDGSVVEMFSYAPVEHEYSRTLYPDGTGGVYYAWTDGVEIGSTTRYARFGGNASGGPVVLSDLVERICARVGIPAGSIDTSELDDEVLGYSVTRQTTARAVIDQLRAAYFFDGVESGPVLAFRKRGKPPVATIDAGELGARIFRVSDSDPDPARSSEFTPDSEAPNELSLTYIDAAADYDVGVQTARRQVGGSTAPGRIELPIVLSADEASRIAWANLLHAHAARNPLAIKLTHAYEQLEPGDAILVPFADGELRRMRIDKRTSARPLVELDGVIEDVSWLDARYPGVSRGAVPQTIWPGTLAATVLVLLDLPPLRAEDDLPLIYTAAAPTDASGMWPGAVAFRSVDGGSSYAGTVSYSRPATIGVTTTALPDWTGGNRWDRASEVTVRLNRGTLSSATELAVLNGINAVAIGNEIVQFATATLVAENEWRLTNLLRGRIGTERFIPGHVSGEAVVLLNEASLRVLSMRMSEVGRASLFKGVTSGQPIADVTPRELTFLGNSVRPLSPVSITGTRVDDDLAITWIRRARINAGWLDSIDVPLDETEERYEIDVMDGATVKRTLTAITTTVAYSAADQTTDFGAPQASVTVRIYQMSDRAGRGHKGEATI